MATVKLLLISANVGSVFEDPSRLLKSWVNEFLRTVAERRPAFIALHMQEVGGKTYEKSMEYVQEFIKQLCEADQLRDYNRIRIYLDEDYHSAEHFTALGNLYFAINTVDTLKIWNFLTHEWESVTDKLIHTGNIETIASKEKAKFPQNFFPECKWSRKGFLRTRWNLEGTVFDMVNIHLFHDASNLAACEEFPSVYCKSRRRALIYTLERFQKDLVNQPTPYFVFGDFNFRCDTGGVVKKLTEDGSLSVHRVPNGNNGLKTNHDSIKQVHYRDAEGTNVLTVGKKEFTHTEHQKKFREDWLRKFDRELDPLREILFEYPITFPPSYPFEEDPTMPMHYMNSRCPAWCDRILMSPSAQSLVESSGKDPEYHIIGDDVCMGDHKPVFLEFNLRTEQGIKWCNCVCKKFVHDDVTRTSCTPSSPGLGQESRRISTESNKENSSVRANNNNNNEESSILCCECNSSPCSSDCPLTSSRPNVHCKSCLERLESIKAKCQEPTMKGELSNKKSKGQQARKELTPLNISIRVIDTDNNVNFCMCSFDNDEVEASIEATENEVGRICGQCQNIINQQPVEHRKALISQRLTMANNIIVNRIDSQYLNTFNGGGGNKVTNFEPYTPDSMESHSPFISTDGMLASSSSSSSFTKQGSEPTTKSENFDQIETAISDDEKETEEETFLDNKTSVNNQDETDEMSNTNEQRMYNKNQKLMKNGVNAFQLKSRLEKLQILNRMNKHAINKRFVYNEEDEDEIKARRKQRRNSKRREEGKLFPSCCCCFYQSAEIEIEPKRSVASTSTCNIM